MVKQPRGQPGYRAMWIGLLKPPLQAKALGARRMAARDDPHRPQLSYAMVSPTAPTVLMR